jgi:BirA family biotin operon repressor/biotin-[acetyl-CoA-carboxylase] ligase
VKPTCEYRLPLRYIGARVLCYDRVGSTNDEALRLAHDPTHTGTVILAAEQAQGRGRHGRRWSGGRQRSLLMSALIFTDLSLTSQPVFMALAGVSVCEVVRLLCEVQPHLKWPNDVLVTGRKLCGILIEQRRNATILGIGLNINQEAHEFSTSGLDEAISLRLLSGREWNISDVANQLIRHLDSEFADVLDRRIRSLEERWASFFGMTGLTVSIEASGRKRQGQLVQMSFDGVRLATEEGFLDLPLHEMTRLSLLPSNVNREQ